MPWPRTSCDGCSSITPEPGGRQAGGGRPCPSATSIRRSSLARPDLLALDEALERLSTLDPRQGRVVELRFFGGLTAEETAAVLGVAPITVKRDWALARTWFYRELREGSR